MDSVLPYKSWKVLVVDDEKAIRKIVRLLLRAEDCQVFEAGTVADAEPILEREKPDVILLDIGLPGESGMSFLDRVAYDHPNSLFIMSTGVDDAAVAAQAMRMGAVDYIVKPYSHGTFISSLCNAMQKRELARENELYRQTLELKVAERTLQVQEVQDATVFAMAKIAQSRDDETGLHLERMRDYSAALARQMAKDGYLGVDDAFILDLYRAAPLHDIGKVGIPDAVLLKKDRLTPEEFDLMKTHSIIGGQCMEGAASLTTSSVGSFLRMGQGVARFHHENWDGSGYPDGRKGDEIPLPARIVSLADFYDALAFPRVYRPTSFPHKKIRAMIAELSGVKFDSDIVTVFFAIEDMFEQIRDLYADEELDDNPTPEHD
jgi:putative two-component system response regulator